MTTSAAEPLAAVVARAIDALDALGLKGEEIEDEWTYVTDLVDAQRLRLESVLERRPDDQVAADRVTAVALAIAETEALADPHKAIDWLSTFPDLVALALDEPVGGSGVAPRSVGP